MKNIIQSSFKESIKLKSKILNSSLIDQIQQVGLELVKILENEGKVIFAGNGGSFSDSQHLTAEFISRFLIDRRALPAITLGTNSSNISAIANDYNYENVFSRT